MRREVKRAGPQGKNEQSVKVWGCMDVVLQKSLSDISERAKRKKATHGNRSLTISHFDPLP